MLRGVVGSEMCIGARVCGGARLSRTGFWITPGIFSDVTDDMSIAREEIFGPVLSVLEFDDEAEVLARANDTQYGLAAGVFTLNLPTAHRICSLIPI